MATLFIGMPVYNGEKFIEYAIESLLRQTFSDWTLLISDNNSVDATESICGLYCRKDKRIHYVKQDKNIGAINNFKFLLESADTPYFMWAAADDVWGDSFVEECIDGMNKQNADWAFTNMINIDTFGRQVREYKSFSQYATDNQYISVVNYVLSPEIFGKANLIYGIYRLSRLKGIMMDLLSSPLVTFQSYDMAFNLGVLCRAKLFIDERTLFHKRYVRITDIEAQTDEVKLDKPYVYGMVNSNDFQEYKNAMIEVSKGTEFEELVQDLMEYRQELQNDVNLMIEDWATRLDKAVEEATWKFAKWTWLKRLLKFV
ncbi:MAG TPA: glycosyltransferase, partial [Nitrosomonas sp.]|nr:glycosyltransferase [Nitrosomonas sp.]